MCWRRTVVRVVSRMAKRIIVSPNKRTEEGIAVSTQMGANYARMEVAGQPWGGWSVDVDNMWCPCNYWFVFGVCVYVLFALRVTDYVDSSGRSILVSRKKRKRGTEYQGGRLPLIGVALSTE